jgi:hypothetical protein
LRPDSVPRHARARGRGGRNTRGRNSEVRAAAGVSLERLYQLYPSKEHLVAADPDARDERWRGPLADHVAANGGSPREQLLAAFDWLGLWFAEPDFRGCAFINAFGELGGSAPLVIGVPSAIVTTSPPRLHAIPKPAAVQHHGPGILVDVHLDLVQPRVGQLRPGLPQ